MSAAEQSRPTDTNTNRGKQRRARFQRMMLAALLVLPFALYLALEAGNDALAVIMFALIALCMALIVWKG